MSLIHKENISLNSGTYDRADNKESLIETKHIFVFTLFAINELYLSVFKKLKT